MPLCRVRPTNLRGTSLNPKLLRKPLKRSSTHLRFRRSLLSYMSDSHSGFFRH